MSHAGREQTDRREFLALLQLLFETDSRSNIFQHDQSAGLSLSILQRRERDVQHQCAVGARRCVKLVDVANLFKPPAVFTEHLLQRVGEVFREQIFNAPADRRVATKIENVFERGV